MPFIDVLSPLGILRVTSDKKALTGVQLMGNVVVREGALAGEAETAEPLLLPAVQAGTAPPLLLRAAAELREYFVGRRKVFDLPLAPAGSAFQQAVWRELCRVPYGMSVTYAELAARVGKPRAARAVGNAVGKNPLLILIPCHRVLGAGNIGGFSAGLQAKKFLLQLEKIPFRESAGNMKYKKKGTDHDGV